MGDEGPFLCRNVDCVDPTAGAPRYPVRGARRVLPAGPAGGLLPGRPHAREHLPRILSAYFGADLRPLPDRSFDWPDNDHIYDFTDVTDRLPLPYGVNGPEGLDLPALESPGASSTPADDLSLIGDE